MHQIKQILKKVGLPKLKDYTTHELNSPDKSHKISGVYTIVNLTNGKIYIGHSCNIYNRIQKHYCDLKGNYHINKDLSSDWNKKDTFTYIILHTYNIQQSCLKEVNYINNIDNKYLYNKKKLVHILSLTKKQQQRFWNKVKVLDNDECHLWLGLLNKDKYGIFTIYYNSYQAHRIAYFLYYNEDPKHLVIRHKCNNPSCCNVKHLIIGTHQDNMQDAVNCGSLSKLTKQNVKKMIKLKKQGKTDKEISKMFKIMHSTVWTILNGKIQTLLFNQRRKNEDDF